jgi:4-cresol dehydrogenase (hydroxylating)
MPSENSEFVSLDSESKSAALKAWTQVVGAQFIRTDSEALNKYARSTGGRGTVPLAILFPICAEEVQKIVRIASQYEIPVYPISRGKNWGYGDACAATDGQVILDFKRMNRIVKVDSTFGYALIEPGVTQGQLCEFLKKHKTGLWMDATGAGPDASIVGNALERGYGHTHYGDHFRTMCGLEVVMPNSEIVRTGFDHLPNAKASQVYGYGIGPTLEGLFTQSNFGIVTQMGLWLSPEPEEFLAFFGQIGSEEEFFETLDRLSSLRRRGVLQSTIHIANDLRIFSGRGRFPWELASADKALPEKVRIQLRQKYQAKKWTFTGAIYGTKEQVKAVRQALVKTLAPQKLIFLNDRKLQKAENILTFLGKFGFKNSNFAQNLKSKLELTTPLFNLLKGIPTEETLKGSAWKIRGEIPAKGYDPLKVGAGILWQAPVLPASSLHAKEVLGIVQPIFARHGFDCPLTFALINERAMTCVMNVFFDKSNKSETLRALACHHEVGESLIKCGYYSYRSSAQGIKGLHAIKTPYWNLLRQIKKAIDPQNILSPGRYIPDEEENVSLKNS